MSWCNEGIQFGLVLSHVGRNSFQNMEGPRKFLEREKKKTQNNYLQLQTFTKFNVYIISYMNYKFKFCP
jgi:hypothetical protein